MKKIHKSNKYAQKSQYKKQRLNNYELSFMDDETSNTEFQRFS